MRMSGRFQALRRFRRFVGFALLSGVALVLSFLLRFDFVVPKSEWGMMGLAALLAAVAKGAIFQWTEADREWHEVPGPWDFHRLVLENVAASAVFSGAAYLLFAPRFPRSVFAIDFVLALLFTSAIRIPPEFWRLPQGRSRAGDRPRKRVLLYGAGHAAATLLMEMHTNKRLRYEPVGLLDDDPSKHAMRVHGIPVLGSGRQAASLAARFKRRKRPIEEIILALPSASGEQMRNALANCRAAGVPCRTVPGLAQLLDGQVLNTQIRAISIEDLLGREPVHLDEMRISEVLTGQTVLVSGAAGSIGSELCRQILRFNPQRIILLDQGESELFFIDQELRTRAPSIPVVPELGTLRSRARIQRIMQRWKPGVILHAAAYKHVPMLEDHVLEAVETNVFGTWNLLQGAIHAGSERFVMISTDKAVNPSSVMGATKRVGEIFVSAFSAKNGSGGTRCAAVRFGNVLGSNGSVVPIFRSQIASGGPVTITHPDMTRYFMSIPEAVQLVLQACSMGDRGEIFVLDMGEPVRILALAENMIRLSGLVPNEDVEIRYTGLRPGEKLVEELNSGSEGVLPTHHKKIKIFQDARRDRDELLDWMIRLRPLVKAADEAEILRHIRILVPEYRLPLQQLRALGAAACESPYRTVQDPIRRNPEPRPDLSLA